MKFSVKMKLAGAFGIVLVLIGIVGFASSSKLELASRAIDRMMHAGRGTLEANEAEDKALHAEIVTIRRQETVVRAFMTRIPYNVSFEYALEVTGRFIVTETEILRIVANASDLHALNTTLDAAMVASKDALFKRLDELKAFRLNRLANKRAVLVVDWSRLILASLIATAIFVAIITGTWSTMSVSRGVAEQVSATFALLGTQAEILQSTIAFFQTDRTARAEPAAVNSILNREIDTNVDHLRARASAMPAALAKLFGKATPFVSTRPSRQAARGGFALAGGDLDADFHRSWTP